jgi:hypothetical protein
LLGKVLQSKTDCVLSVPSIGGKFPVVESLAAVVLAFHPLLLRPAFGFLPVIEKPPLPPALDAGIAEINRLAVVARFPDLRPRLPFGFRAH